MFFPHPLKLTDPRRLAAGFSVAGGLQRPVTRGRFESRLPPDSGHGTQTGTQIVRNPSVDPDFIKKLLHDSITRSHAHLTRTAPRRVFLRHLLGPFGADLSPSVGLYVERKVWKKRNPRNTDWHLRAIFQKDSKGT